MIPDDVKFTLKKALDTAEDSGYIEDMHAFYDALEWLDNQPTPPQPVQGMIPDEVREAWQKVHHALYETLWLGDGSLKNDDGQADALQTVDDFFDAQPTPLHGYVAICRTCSKPVGATVDDGEHIDDMVAGVAEWLMHGYVIERMELERAREMMASWCDCEVTQ